MYLLGETIIILVSCSIAIAGGKLWHRETGRWGDSYQNSRTEKYTYNSVPLSSGNPLLYTGWLKNVIGRLHSDMWIRRKLFLKDTLHKTISWVFLWANSVGKIALINPGFPVPENSAIKCFPLSSPRKFIFLALLCVLDWHRLFIPRWLPLLQT